MLATAGFLKNLLSAGDSRPFDELISEFNSEIQEASRSFDCCDTIAIVTYTKELSPTERLVGFAILHQAYSSEQTSSNPFISVLVNAASNEQAENFERAFILQLLGSTSSTNIAEVLKLSAADYIRNFDPSSLVVPPREQLQQQYCSKVSCDINSTEFDLQSGVTPKIGSGARDETVSGLLQNLSLEGLGPERVRPRLSGFPVLEGEPEGLNPDNTYEQTWDGGKRATTVEPAKGSTVEDLTVEDLIAKGLEGPLEPAEEEQVLLRLGDKPPLPAEKLPVLVENNPNIAAEVLTKLKDPSKIKMYYTVLYGMKMGFNVIEVVNKLNKGVKLRTDLVQLCINRGFTFWETIENLLQDDNPQKAFDLLFKLAEFPGIKGLVVSSMIKRPLADFWDSIKDGDPQIAFDFLFKLAEFTQIKEQFIRLVDDSHMIDQLLAVRSPTFEFIQRFIKSCIPSLSRPKDSHPLAILLLDFLKKLIQRDIIEGRGSLFLASCMGIVAGFIWSWKPVNQWSIYREFIYFLFPSPFMYYLSVFYLYSELVSGGEHVRGFLKEIEKRKTLSLVELVEWAKKFWPGIEI